MTPEKLKQLRDYVCNTHSFSSNSAALNVVSDLLDHIEALESSLATARAREEPVPERIACLEDGRPRCQAMCGGPDIPGLEQCGLPNRHPERHDPPSRLDVSVQSDAGTLEHKFLAQNDDVLGLVRKCIETCPCVACGVARRVAGLPE